jgi:hypothetical protein
MSQLGERFGGSAADGARARNALLMANPGVQPKRRLLFVGQAARLDQVGPDGLGQLTATGARPDCLLECCVGHFPSSLSAEAPIRGSASYEGTDALLSPHRALRPCQGAWSFRSRLRAAFRFLSRRAPDHPQNALVGKWWEGE